MHKVVSHIARASPFSSMFKIFQTIWESKVFNSKKQKQLVLRLVQEDNVTGIQLSREIYVKEKPQYRRTIPARFVTTFLFFLNLCEGEGYDNVLLKSYRKISNDSSKKDFEMFLKIDIHWFPFSFLSRVMYQFISTFSIYFYSSTNSQSINAASVPPTVTIFWSLYKNLAHATSELYTFSSTYSALALVHGYRKSLK